MASVKDWYGSVEYKMAKVGGFKKKKPKKPKSKTVTSLTNYVRKYDAWVRDMKQYAKRGKAKYQLQEKVKRM